MAADETLTHEYLDMLGDPDYSIAATKMLLGKESIALKEGRAFGIQALSGTGSLRIGADFLRSCLGADSVYISAPSWRKLISWKKYSWRKIFISDVIH